MTAAELTRSKPEGCADGMTEERQDTILVVDDEETIRHIVPGILERRGYRVLVADDGMRALTICSEFAGRIDLLLTDVMMPRMDGCEVARCIMQQRPGIKVMYMSGYAESVLMRYRSLPAGRYFLPKPFLYDTLVRKVREALEC